MPPSWARDTITRVRPQLIDDGHGNQVPDLSDLAAGDHLAIPRCNVQPGVSVENRGLREAVRTALSVFAPAGSDVTQGDYVSWQAVTYRVVAQPEIWSSPTGARSHMRIDLEVWEG